MPRQAIMDIHGSYIKNEHGFKIYIRNYFLMCKTKRKKLNRSTDFGIEDFTCAGYKRHY